MKLLPLLSFAFVVACAADDAIDGDFDPTSIGSGGSCDSSSGPTTSTKVVECGREGGFEWSVIYLSLSQSSDKGCALLEVRRSDTADDAGLSIAVPEGAVLASAKGGRGATCFQPRDGWPPASQGTGSIAFTLAPEPTAVDVDVTLTFPDEPCPVDFDFEADVICGG